MKTATALVRSRWTRVDRILLIGVRGWTVAEWKTMRLGTLRGRVLGLDSRSVPASQET